MSVNSGGNGRRGSGDRKYKSPWKTFAVKRAKNSVVAGE